MILRIILNVTRLKLRISISNTEVNLFLMKVCDPFRDRELSLKSLHLSRLQNKNNQRRLIEFLALNLSANCTASAIANFDS